MCARREQPIDDRATLMGLSRVARAHTTNRAIEWIEISTISLFSPFSFALAGNGETLTLLCVCGEKIELKIYTSLNRFLTLILKRVLSIRDDEASA